MRDDEGIHCDLGTTWSRLVRLGLVAGAAFGFRASVVIDPRVTDDGRPFGSRDEICHQGTARFLDKLGMTDYLVGLDGRNFGYE